MNKIFTVYVRHLARKNNIPHK